MDAKTIQILNGHQDVVFEIQASSSIISIFSEDNLHIFSKMLIKKAEPKMLAIDKFNGTPENIFSSELVKAMNSGLQKL